MRFIKKFENFFLSPDVESDEEDYLRNKRNSIMNPEMDEEDTELEGMPSHNMPMDEMPEDEYEGEGEEEEDEYEEGEEEENNFNNNHIMSFEAKNNSYKKGKSKSKPDFLDLDKDGNKKESMKKAAKDAKSKDVKSDKKGLSAAQKKLPAGLQKAILAKKK